MESAVRDKSLDRRRGKEIRGRSKGQERMTIMIFKNVGKVQTFKISSRLIFWASLFFLFYIVATIFLTNEYFDIYRINKMQAYKIDELRREIIKNTKILERSKQHIALLGDYIRENKEQIPEPMSKVDYTESSLPKLLDIDELKIERDGSDITINFKIINRQLNEEPIGGYIFVIASVRGADQSKIWSYPNSMLKGGFPVDYKKGRRFFIKRFTSISSKCTLSRSVDKPLILKLLAYDREGRLILKKIVEVGFKALIRK